MSAYSEAIRAAKREDVREMVAKKRMRRSKVVGSVGYNPGAMPTPPPVQRYTKQVKA